jgi:hypothetical protein
MKYINVKNGSTVYPYYLDQLARDNPNTSFPENITDAILADYGVYVVTDVAQPSCDPSTQVVMQDTAPTQNGGSWTLGWTVRDKTPEELAVTQAATKATLVNSRLEAYRAEADPLFFMAQRGEATMEEWLAKVAEIKARFPYSAA